MTAARKILRRMFFLASSRMPILVWKALVPSVIREQKARIDQKGCAEDFKESTVGMELSSYWFLTHIPVWSWIFRPKSSEVLRILEIGSWEGLSVRFLSKLFPLAQITAVDTWLGSDENREVPRNLEQRFKRNTAEIRQRLTPFKGRSSEYFCGYVGEHFDLIYVDGSHDSRDVLMDGLAGWRILRPGGYMVFDDYMWFYYEEPWLNPGWGINNFLHVVRQEAEILHAGYQLFVRKK